ncbi:MAG: c-type cytochrome [Alphaproteobacteria bacterium]|nr:c-type cytochrome [Alphaproteobacteria bacterium]
MRTRLAVVLVGVAALAGCVDDSSPIIPPRPVDPAVEAALIEDGRSIAEANCAQCHAIGLTGESPSRQAPLFRSVLSRYNPDVLETELTLGMRVAHEPMPEFQFKPEAATALISYLRSIQTRDPGQALVEHRCARCHAVGATGVSPYPGAQPFRNLGRRWWRSQLADALRTGIIVEHDKADVRLPPMKLSDPEIEVFLNYLDSIATPENPAPRRP